MGEVESILLLFLENWKYNLVMLSPKTEMNEMKEIIIII